MSDLGPQVPKSSPAAPQAPQAPQQIILITARGPRFRSLPGRATAARSSQGKKMVETWTGADVYFDR